MPPSRHAVPPCPVAAVRRKGSNPVRHNPWPHVVKGDACESGRLPFPPSASPSPLRALPSRRSLAPNLTKHLAHLPRGRLTHVLRPASGVRRRLQPLVEVRRHKGPRLLLCLVCRVVGR